MANQVTTAKLAHELVRTVRIAERALELVSRLAQYPDGLSHRKAQELIDGRRDERIAVIDVAVAEGWLAMHEQTARGGTQRVLTVTELGHRVIRLGTASRELETDDAARRIIDQRLRELAVLERQIFDERNALLEARRQIGK